MWLLGHPDPSHLSSLPWEENATWRFHPWPLRVLMGPHGTAQSRMGCDEPFHSWSQSASLRLRGCPSSPGDCPGREDDQTANPSERGLISDLEI